MKRYKTRYHSKPFSVRRWEKKGKRRLTLTIILGAFLLYALLSWILPALIGGLSYFNKFKETPTQKASVAENSTLAPPVLNIPYEATNTASIAIKGYSVPNASVEVYLDDELKTTAKTHDDGSFTTDNISLFLGTNNISGKTVDDKGNKSFPSKPIRILYSNEKPGLEVSSPGDNQEIKGGDKKVLISGSTDPNKGIIVTVNGSQLIVNSEGKFSQTIDISDGENNITVAATDTANNTAQVTRKVIYSAQ